VPAGRRAREFTKKDGDMGKQCGKRLRTTSTLNNWGQRTRRVISNFQKEATYRKEDKLREGGGTITRSARAKGKITQKRPTEKKEGKNAQTKKLGRGSSEPKRFLGCRLLKKERTGGGGTSSPGNGCARQWGEKKKILRTVRGNCNAQYFH